MKGGALLFLVCFSSGFLRGLDLHSGGQLSISQSSMDIHHYDIDLKVDPYKKTISGSVKIKFTLLKSTPELEIDLYQQFTVSGVLINGMSLGFDHRDNTIFIKNPDIDLFTHHQLKIIYGGSPPVAERPPWDGGFTWDKSDNGRPWVGVSCQGNGAHIWYPCKEHPSDKADSADIRITAPKPLIAVANGLLVSQKEQEDLWTTWHWKTQYPISTYNINFSLGDFDIIEKTGYVLEEPLKIIYYVLPEAQKGGKELLDKAEEYLNFYATTFGQYPWIKEKFGLVNTPYWGMEHQTMIAYGNDYKNNEKGYDFLLFHEMSHEWWGNYLSVSDWADLWIHEGFAVYTEALYLEEKYGIEEYNKFFRKKIIKKIPLAQSIVPHRNATIENVSGLDPYNKGAYVLHMLRYLIGDDKFFEILSEFLYSKKQLPNNQVTTKDFIDLVHLKTESKIDWFFKTYLYEKDYPVLIQNTKHGSNHTFIDLYWENKNFSMPVEVYYNSNTGLRQRKLSLTNKPTMIAIPHYNKIKIDPNKRILLTIKNKS